MAGDNKNVFVAHLAVAQDPPLQANVWRAAGKPTCSGSVGSAAVASAIEDNLARLLVLCVDSDAPRNRSLTQGAIYGIFPT